MGRLRTTVLLVLLLCAPRLRAAEPALVVIVHPDRTDAPSRDDLARIFLARKRFWADGVPIVPINLPAGGPLRERFSREVLHEDSAHLAGYWNEQYFHGVLPPAVLSSTDAVKRYVAGEPRAIGYIEASRVDGSVKVVLTIE